MVDKTQSFEWQLVMVYGHFWEGLTILRSFR